MLLLLYQLSKSYPLRIFCWLDLKLNRVQLEAPAQKF